MKLWWQNMHIEQRRNKLWSNFYPDFYPSVHEEHGQRTLPEWCLFFSFLLLSIPPTLYHGYCPPVPMPMAPGPTIGHLCYLNFHSHVFHWASDPMWMSHGCPIYKTQRMQLLFSNLFLYAHPCEWVHHLVLPLETQAYFLLPSFSSLHFSVSCLVMVSLKYYLKSHLSFFSPPLPTLAAASDLELVSWSLTKLRSILLYVSRSVFLCQPYNLRKVTTFSDLVSFGK